MNLSTKPPKASTASVSSSNISFCSAGRIYGSTRSLRAVKPQRSAKTTVTVRRSAPESAPGRPDAAGAGAGGDGDADDLGTDGWPTCVPHCGQKAKCWGQG